MDGERSRRMMEIIKITSTIAWAIGALNILCVSISWLYRSFKNSLEEPRLLFPSRTHTQVPAYKPPAPTRKHCSLCNNGENSINSISGLTITSPYSIYDLGWLDDVEYCPCCGRKLKKAESKIIPKSNK